MDKRLLVSCIWVLVPSAASAQSFHLQAATLERDGEAVGEVSRLPVEVVRWLDATTARVRHVDDAVTLEADVDLADPQDFLQAGVGRDVRLRGTGAWKVTMLRGAWAPVLRGSEDEVRVALPPALPVSWGRIIGQVEGAPAAPDRGPWAFVAAAGEAEASTDGDAEALGELIQHCPGLTIHAGPRLEDPGWLVPETTHDIRKVGFRAGWYEVRVRHEGFLLEGFLERSAAGYDGVLGGLGLSGVGTGCGDGIARGRVVRLAPGTQLYATADAEQPFATLHRENTGLEPADRTFARACRRSAGQVEQCEQVAIPPLPTGFVRWIVEPEGTDGGMVLTGFVHVPAEELPDQDPAAPSAGAGFGLCSPGFTDWPRPAVPSPAPAP
jgi:hypothetical protein